MIGLIFGDADFPKLILKKIKKINKKYLILDLSRKNIFKKDSKSFKVDIGKFASILKLLREHKCNKVIFAGKIDKPNLSNLKLDITGIYYLPRIIKAYKKGDAAILKELINILALEKIKVIKSTFFTPELTLKKGIYTKHKPTKDDLIDIKKGENILKKTNAFDHIQAIVVRENAIFKESSKGTKNLIKKMNKTKIKRGVLIKYPKRKQDMKVDLPTIGLDTLKDCKKAGLKGIVLKKNQNIVLEKNKCINFAIKNKMFIIVK
ncbi:UDP-2,3-diacylglucosamine diphosphatase LpxI [Candidatus Pelagibacter sp.]|nr:UDP-2,3-diacylglucosamine diphosphatase LpxI [Candidatus Pelagibacter sp.]